MYLNYRATHGNMHGIGDAGDSRSPAAEEREESKEPRRRNNPISHRREARPQLPHDRPPALHLQNASMKAMEKCAAAPN